MKQILNFTGSMLVILAFAFFTNTASAQSKDTAKTKTATSSVTFTATGMGCKTDSKMVETALYRKKGVKSVSIQGETITVVYYTSKVTTDELKAVIENTGTCEDPNAKAHKVTVKTY